MRIFVRAIVCVLAVASLVAPAVAQEPQTDEEKTLYALGAMLSRSLRPMNLTPAELDMIKAGMTDGALGRRLKVDTAPYAGKVRQLRNRQALNQPPMPAMPPAEAQAFLDKEAAAPNARKTASGLIIVPLAPGNGPSPTPRDRVKVNFKGLLPDGTEFENTQRKGQPLAAGLNGMIKCLAEGLQLMQVGAKSRLVCPPDLAYGDRGVPSKIQPGTPLVFEIELVEIVK